MSRHAFREILGNEAGLFACVRSLDDAGNADSPRDLKGYGRLGPAARQIAGSCSFVAVCH